MATCKKAVEQLMMRRHSAITQKNKGSGITWIVNLFTDAMTQYMVRAPFIVVFGSPGLDNMH